MFKQYYINNVTFNNNITLSGVDIQRSINISRILFNII